MHRHDNLMFCHIPMIVKYGLILNILTKCFVTNLHVMFCGDVKRRGYTGDEDMRTI
jgi:hypothetical protein